MPDLTHLQSIVIGALRGVTELSPVSRLNHSAESPHLAFLVALPHALAGLRPGVRRRVPGPPHVTRA